MTTLFFVLSILGLALTVNAWRPIRHVWVSVFVFFAGWLTAELAPLLLVLHIGGVAWFVAQGAVQGALGTAALGISVGVAGGLVALIVDAQRSSDIVERALVDGLGETYERRSEAGARALGVSIRRMLLPFWLWDRAVKRHRNIRYGPAGRRNLLDVYVGSDAPTNAPVLLYVHGGAWITVSNKDHQGKPLMLHLASRGWVCVSANYRLSPRATFPDHVIDVKRALAWIRENIATYGGDPNFVVVTGGSAGGHLASLAAITANDPEYQPGFESANTSVAACVSSYGVYDFTPGSGIPLSEQRLGFIERLVLKARYADDPSVFERASPHHRLHPDVPPFLVIHGMNDSLVSVEEARRFVARVREVSTSPVCYAELGHTQHAFDVFHSIRTGHVVRAIERFCDWVYAGYRWARAPDGADAEQR